MDPGDTIKSSELVGDRLLFLVVKRDGKLNSTGSASDIISLHRVETQKLEDHTISEEGSSLKNQRGLSA